MDLLGHNRRMAQNNLWSNDRLYRAVLALRPGEFEAERTSFFPSIKATLNHILTVDWYYLEALERSRQGLPPHENPGRHYEPEEPFDDCTSLAAAQRAADHRLIAYCEALEDSQLDDVVLIPRRIGIVRERVRRLLAHVFEHQLHHRGQAHAMLAGTRVKPPQLDEFFCTEEAHLRAADFAELGFSEERIWGERVGAP